MLALKPADAPLACAPAPGEDREEGGAATGFRGQPGHGDEDSAGSGGENGACDEAPHTWLDSGDSGELQLPGRELLRVVADGLLRGGGATQGWEGGARAHGEQAPHRVGGPIGTASTPSLPVELDRTTVRARSTVRRTARAVEGWAAGGLPLGKPRPGPVPPRDTPPHAAHHPTPAGHDTRHAVGAADGGAATAGGVHPLRARPAKPPRDKRPRDITQEDLASCFHLPSEQACKALGIGLTVLKRQCRIFGIARWPFRKLASLDRLINNVESGVGLPPSTAAALDIKSVEQLQLQKAALEGLAITELDPATKKLQQAYSKATHRLRRQQQRKVGDSDVPRASRPLPVAAPAGGAGGGAGGVGFGSAYRLLNKKAFRKQLAPRAEQPFGSSDSDDSGSGGDDDVEEAEEGEDLGGKRPRRPNPKYMNPKPGGRQPGAGAKGGHHHPHHHGGPSAFRTGVPGHDADLLASLAAAMEAVAGDGKADGEGDVDMDGGTGGDGHLAPPAAPNGAAPEAGHVQVSDRGPAQWRARIVAAVDEHACRVEETVTNALGTEAMEALRPGLLLTCDALREKLLAEEVGDS